MSYTRQQLEEWIKTIDVKADRVLDIGGSQLPIKGRTKNWDVKEYKILDLKQPHESKKKPNIVCDIQKSISSNLAVQEYSLNENRFDIIFCIEVSEYWWNPATALNNIMFLSKKGCILYISFHFIYPMHNPKGKDCLRYTRWGVEKLLKEASFEIEEIIPRLARNGKDLIKWFVSEEGMRPCQTYNGHTEVGYLVKAKKV